MFSEFVLRIFALYPLASWNFSGLLYYIFNDHFESYPFVHNFWPEVMLNKYAYRILTGVVLSHDSNLTRVFLFGFHIFLYMYINIHVQFCVYVDAIKNFILRLRLILKRKLQKGNVETLANERRQRLEFSSATFYCSRQLTTR